MEYRAQKQKGKKFETITIYMCVCVCVYAWSSVEAMQCADLRCFALVLLQ